MHQSQSPVKDTDDDQHYLSLKCSSDGELIGDSVIKDGAYYCYRAYVLRITRYSVFLWVVLINTGIFLRGSKLCGESRT